MAWAKANKYSYEINSSCILLPHYLPYVIAMMGQVVPHPCLAIDLTGVTHWLKCWLTPSQGVAHIWLCLHASALGVAPFSCGAYTLSAHSVCLSQIWCSHICSLGGWGPHIAGQSTVICSWDLGQPATVSHTFWRYTVGLRDSRITGPKGSI